MECRWDNRENVNIVILSLIITISKIHGRAQSFRETLRLYHRLRARPLGGKQVCRRVMEEKDVSSRWWRMRNKEKPSGECALKRGEAGGKSSCWSCFLGNDELQHPSMNPVTNASGPLPSSFERTDWCVSLRDSQDYIPIQEE